MKTIKFLTIGFALLLILSSCSKKYIKTENGFKTVLDSTIVEIQFYSPEIVRVVKHKKGFSYVKKSHAVIKAVEKVPFSVSTDDNLIVASSSKMNVALTINTGAISFTTTENKKLLRELPNGASFTLKEDIGETTYAVKQSYQLDANEHIYGLGQFQDGKMSQRNQRLNLLQDVLITAIPFLQSTKGYGVYWDNYSQTYFTDTFLETSFESTVGDCIDYYFINGGDADGVIAQIRDLTGQVPMFPYWTYGYWQSKERYKSQDEIVGVVKKYRELGVPIDGVIQDWQYWGDNYHWNAMEFLNPEFPNPKGMVEEIHRLNAHMIISIWSSFGPQTKQFPILAQKNMLFDFKTWPITDNVIWPPPNDNIKPSGVKVYDAYNPEAREIYWNHLNEGIFSLGMDGWWMDSTEPDHYDIKDSDYNQKTYLGSFRKFRNLYPLMAVGGVYDHQREVSTEKRVFILTRSAFAGQQRYGTNSWSGDVDADWPAFKNQISAGLNFSLCGLPYWNSDIGGFRTVKFPGGVENSAYKELYVRWLQFGAFCPMMRSHGTDTPREIYQFGEKGTWAYDGIEKFINLRYRLLPYIYSVSWDVTTNGSSMMRALMMDFVDDKNTLDINDQYMFGQSILVCPVTESMYVNSQKDKDSYINSVEDFTQVKSTKVYLPVTTKWIDFWTGKTYDGGQTIEKETPIDIIPLYIKVGSIIPMGPKVQYANEKTGPVELHIYPGANGEFILYYDEKDNYNYEKGLYATIKLSWNDKTQTLTLGERQGSFPGMAKELQLNIVLVDSDKGNGMEPSRKVNKRINYSGDEIILRID